MSRPLRGHTTARVWKIRWSDRAKVQRAAQALSVQPSLLGRHPTVDAIEEALSEAPEANEGAGKAALLHEQGANPRPNDPRGPRYLMAASLALALAVGGVVGATVSPAAGVGILGATALAGLGAVGVWWHRHRQYSQCTQCRMAWVSF